MRFRVFPGWRFARGVPWGEWVAVGGTAVAVLLGVFAVGVAAAVCFGVGVVWRADGFLAAAGVASVLDAWWVWAIAGAVAGLGGVHAWVYEDNIWAPAREAVTVVAGAVVWALFGAGLVTAGGEVGGLWLLWFGGGVVWWRAVLVCCWFVLWEFSPAAFWAWLFVGAAAAVWAAAGVAVGGGL